MEGTRREIGNAEACERRPGGIFIPGRRLRKQTDLASPANQPSIQHRVIETDLKKLRNKRGPALDADKTLGGFERAEQDFQQSGLTATVWPEDREELAGRQALVAWAEDPMAGLVRTVYTLDATDGSVNGPPSGLGFQNKKHVTRVPIRALKRPTGISCVVMERAASSMPSIRTPPSKAEAGKRRR